MESTPQQLPAHLVDAIAREMMTDLLASRRFQRHWIEELQKVLEIQRNVEERNAADKADIIAIKDLELQEVENAISQLVDGLQLAVETFLRSVRLAEITHKFNNEAATLYSVRVQLDRFIMADEFVHSRFLFIARRLVYLIRMFSIRVSNPFDIISMEFYASTLCDMLYRVEEHVSIHCKTKKGLYLRRATDDFYANVVKKLNSMLSKAKIPRSRSAQSLKTTTFGGGTSPLTQAQTHSSTGGVTIAFRPSYSDNRPKSFLLPADLAEKRHQFRQSAAFQRSMSASKFAAKTPSHRLNKTVGARPASTEEEIERRWEKFMKNNEVLEKSLRGTPEERDALRLACELTREVVDDLANRMHIS